MIDRIFKSISLIFHPLFIPLFGVTFYFWKTPRYILPKEIIIAKLISLIILTVILPILLYFLLKTLGKVKTINLESTSERLIPLALNCFVTLIIIKRIIKPSELIELYYFFIGIFISTLTCLILAIIRFKASIHMIAISGLFMFIIDLSIHFTINLNNYIALLSIILGAVASSRLHLKAHTPRELTMGFFVGLLPQLILVNYWL